MAGELEPKKQSIFKRPLTRKPKPEEPLDLNQLQDLPDSRTSHAISRNPKLVGESAPLLIGTIGPASAAGAMGVTSVLFNFIAAWIANTSIQSMISPTPYDRLVMKLDKHALQIMQARDSKCSSIMGLWSKGCKARAGRAPARTPSWGS